MAQIISSDNIEVTVELSDNPEHYLSVLPGKIVGISDKQYRYKLRVGLSGISDSVSFESAIQPSQYIQIFGSSLVLRQAEKHNWHKMTFMLGGSEPHLTLYSTHKQSTYAFSKSENGHVKLDPYTSKNISRWSFKFHTDQSPADPCEIGSYYSDYNKKCSKCPGKKTTAVRGAASQDECTGMPTTHVDFINYTIKS